MSSDLSPETWRRVAQAAGDRPPPHEETLAAQVADHLEDAIRDEMLRLRQLQPWLVDEPTVRAAVEQLIARLPQLAEELAMP